MPSKIHDTGLTSNERGYIANLQEDDILRLTRNEAYRIAAILCLCTGHAQLVVRYNPYSVGGVNLPPRWLVARNMNPLLDGSPTLYVGIKTQAAVALLARLTKSEGR